MSDPIRYWQTLTTTEAAALVDLDPVVILPLAAIEQHGPHLPLSTDLDIGLGLLREAFRQLPDDLPVWVLPPQTTGASREHLRFTGTLSLEPELVTELIHQHGTALAASGVRRLVLFNSHGGNLRALDAAALRLRDKHGILVVKASYFAFSCPADVGASGVRVASRAARRRGRNRHDAAPVSGSGTHRHHPVFSVPGSGPGRPPAASRPRRVKRRSPGSRATSTLTG